jgi:hypothetical protein
LAEREQPTAGPWEIGDIVDVSGSVWPPVAERGILMDTAHQVLPETAKQTLLDVVRGIAPTDFVCSSAFIYASLLPQFSHDFPSISPAVEAVGDGRSWSFLIS